MRALEKPWRCIRAIPRPPCKDDVVSCHPQFVGFAQGQARIAVLKSKAAKLIGGVTHKVKEVASKLTRSKVLQPSMAAAAAG